ncbi:MAG: LarC family nickel insertion protein [Clostridiales bacterium]|nr:LarC family nickel insertion protein [Clostridiales bacterium]
MSKTLYLECFSGISGDMTVAALLDLGASQDVLRKGIESLHLKGYEIVIHRVKKSGLDVCDFDVILDSFHENHDHDMEYLHGHHHENGSHQEEEHHHEHHHEHRSFLDIVKIINHSDLTEPVKKTAIKIFNVLAEAEAKAHGVLVQDVHFHEVGAIDSIIDIVSVAICLDNLGIKQVIVPKLYEGTGFVRCQHGTIPVPVPAVANITSAHSIKLQITDIQGELVTPTGAAIVAAIRTDDKLPEDFIIDKIGMGAGKRNYDTPGILRAILIG